MYEGYPWDYSFTCAKTIKNGTDRTVEVLETFFEKVTKDPFRNKNTLPTVLVIFFCSDFNGKLVEKGMDSQFAQVDPSNFLHHYIEKQTYRRGRPPQLHLCYLEASIAATYYFRLNSAVVACYSSGTWSISTVEDLKNLKHHFFLKMFSTAPRVSDEILKILEEHPTKYGNNIILCTDVSPVDVQEKFSCDREEKEWKYYKSGTSDCTKHLESLSQQIKETKKDVDIWILKSHKDLVKGGSLFAKTPDMEKLPKHYVSL